MRIHGIKNILYVICACRITFTKQSTRTGRIKCNLFGSTKDGYNVGTPDTIHRSVLAVTHCLYHHHFADIHYRWNTISSG